MEKLKLNKTPVRTANNFNINDVELALDLKKYENVKEFTNVNVISDELSKIKVLENNTKIIDSKIGIELKPNYTLTLEIPEMTKIKEPVVIEFDVDETLVDNVKIVFQKNSNADIVLKYTSKGETFHYLKQETIVEENATASVTIANMLDEKSTSIIAIENEVSATLNYTIVDFGGATKISNYYANVKEYNAENNLKTIYLGKGKDLLDINYKVDIVGQSSKCNIEAQGVLDDSANKAFKGTIDFKEGCKGAKGAEVENCTLLSSKAISKSLPMLLCHEEDVEGEHGVASGKIDEGKLFYLMSRGLSYQDAKKLIIKANFNGIINKITDKTLVEEVLKIIDNI